MEIRVILWRAERTIVRVDAGGLSMLTVCKDAKQATRIEVPDVHLSSDETKAMVKALELAAKVAGYLDELEPDAARDAIQGLPTTPYDGWRPTPRAGRTENL